MKHNIIVINSRGQIGVNGNFYRVLNSKSLFLLAKQVEGFHLRISEIYMTETDYRDIMEWGKEDET